MAKKTLTGPGGIRLVLDQSKVVPNDPGADTPAMVHLFNYSATYWCACGEGELHSGIWHCGTRRLTQEQLLWLGEQDSLISDFLYKQQGL